MQFSITNSKINRKWIFYGWYTLTFTTGFSRMVEIPLHISCSEEAILKRLKLELPEAEYEGMDLMLWNSLELLVPLNPELDLDSALSS